jgi:type II secretory pathway pseudopilin PulG
MAGELINMVGIESGNRRRKNHARSQRGVTLIETLIAAMVLIIVAAGLLPIFVLGMQATYQQGNEATRTTEYAQDKMEQLLTLNQYDITTDGFNDGITDTTVFPAKIDGSTGCTGTGANICGIGGTMAASSTIGSIPPTAPVKYFVDYLAYDGTLLTSSTNAFYTRQWMVSTDATGKLKTITIVASSLQTAVVRGLAPSTTLVCMKASGL